MADKTYGHTVVERLQDTERWSSYDEGGILPTGALLPTEQAERGLAWIRDHYGPDGEFRCPCDREA